MPTAGKPSKSRGIAAGCGDVIDGDHGHESSHGWSQNENLGEGKLSRWSDWPEVARLCQKMARMLAAVVEYQRTKAIAGGDHDGAGIGYWNGMIAGCEVVMVVPVRWSGVDRRLAGSEPKCGQS